MDELYKGYVRSDGKEPKERFKNVPSSELRTLEEARKCNSYNAVLKDDTILVDIDDSHEADILFKIVQDKQCKCRVVQTTRGKHFLFKNKDDIILNKAHVLACGLHADIKIGYKNSTECLKKHGVEREIIYDTKQYEEIPYWLRPVHTKKEFVDKEEGDRNDDLYGYQVVLQHNCFTYEEMVETLDIINKYVVKEPVSEEEFKNITRREAYEKCNLYYGDPKDMISFTEWLIKRLDIQLYKWNNYFYDEKSQKYISEDRLLLRQVAKFLKLRSSQDNEILRQIPKFAKIFPEDVKMPIRLKNKILDVENNLIEPDKKVFTVFNLDVDYDPDAYDEYVDKFLNDITLNRTELRTVLEEVLGHILITNNLPAYVFFLKGNGKNGKSTFLEMINNFVGDVGNNIGLEDFNDATSVVSLIGKLVNCSDETDRIYIERCKGYKSLASGNTISVRPIYSKPVKVKNTATLILNANKMPNFKDKTGGFFRRLVIIPFDYDLEKENKIIPKLIDKLSTDNAKSYILNLALKGLKRIENNNNEITYSELLEKEKLNYRVDTDSVVAFLEDYSETFGHGKTIEGVFITDLYSQYIKYCNSEGKNSVGKSEFSERVRENGYQSKPVPAYKEDGSSTTKRAYFRKN